MCVPSPLPGYVPRLSGKKIIVFGIAGSPALKELALDLYICQSVSVAMSGLFFKATDWLIFSL